MNGAETRADGFKHAAPGLQIAFKLELFLGARGKRNRGRESHTQQA